MTLLKIWAALTSATLFTSFAQGALAQGASDSGPAPASKDAALAIDGQPLAGFRNGLFFLRDRHDDFRLYPQARAQVDGFSYFGPGVSHTTLKPTLLLRRVRPELAGEFFGRWSFMIAGDFGATAFDNPSGTQETSAAAPGVAPSASSGRYAGAQTARVSAGATDVFVSVRAMPALNIQLGQFDAPFTLENRTSDKYLPFMERALAVRGLGIPTNKEIGAMLWGETADHVVYYSGGVFAGDGQNRLNADGNADFIGRAFVHPLHGRADELKNLQFGLSARYGRRSSHFVNYDYSALTTQGNYAFWSPVYRASTGWAHVIPSGAERALAAEMRVPFDRFDLTSEFVYASNDTREAAEGTQASASLRQGDIRGYSYYVQLGAWPLGPRDINGLPGYENPSHIDFSRPEEAPATALQLLVRWEQLRLRYASASRAGSPDAASQDGVVLVDAASFGANYWVSKHVRLTSNFITYFFPKSAPVSATRPGGAAQTSEQRAVAPGNTLAVGKDDTARDTAHAAYELSFRLAVAL